MSIIDEVIMCWNAGGYARTGTVCFLITVACGIAQLLIIVAAIIHAMIIGARELEKKEKKNGEEE